MFAQLEIVAIGSPKVEPTVAVGTVLDVGDVIDPSRHQFVVGIFGVVHPEAGDRAGVEMLVLNRIGAEQLHPIPIVSNQPGEADDIGGDL